MAASPWRSALNDPPADATGVWVRVLTAYQEPWFCELDSSTMEFVGLAGLDEIRIPYWSVIAWRPE